jgi:anti-sigma B factor antagonist
MTSNINSIGEVQNRSGFSIIQFFGFVDAGTVEQIKPVINARLSADCSHLIINLDKVEFLDSHGVGLFVSLLKRIHSKKGLMIFAGARDQPASVLNMVGFNSKLVTYCDSQQQAEDLLKEKVV